MVATLYPPARFRPVRNTSGVMAQLTRGLLPHVQQGDGSLFGWFDNPKSQVSAHLWIAKSGAVEQYVPFDRRAWAQAAGNSSWISVECEGWTREDYTAAQIRALGELFAWGVRNLSWRAEITDSPNGYGLGTHRMGGAAWGGHSCPGDLRANRRGDILRAALNVLNPKPEVDVPLTDDEIRRISKQVRDDLMADVLGAADEKHPIKQWTAGMTVGATYLKVGDAQSSLKALLEAVGILETRLLAVETEVSRIGTHLGDGGPLATWTAAQAGELASIRVELTRIVAGESVDLSPVLDRLARLTLTAQ